jgi:hypothetical protein
MGGKLIKSVIEIRNGASRRRNASWSRVEHGATKVRDQAGNHHQVTLSVSRVTAFLVCGWTILANCIVALDSTDLEHYQVPQRCKTYE